MKTIHWKTMQLITTELANLPLKYRETNFASAAEGIAVIREEYLELEQEVFWGLKKMQEKIKASDFVYSEQVAADLHKEAMREEAVQLAGVCIRFIQECCEI
jgi:hypothetical protein